MNLYRRGRVLLDCLRGRELAATPGPAWLALESTNRCNYACVMCPHEQMRRPQGLMDPALAERVMRQCAPTLEFVILHFMGEPLLHPEIHRLTEIVKGFGVPAGMSTNLSVFAEEKFTAFFRAGLDLLVLCLDGCTPATYEKIRRQANYERSLANLEAILRVYERVGTPRTKLVLQMIALDENDAEIDAFARAWRPRVPYLRIKRRMQWQQPAPPPAAARRVCAKLYRELTVAWNGDVALCHRDFDVSRCLGNAQHMPLAEIWNGAVMRETRRLHRERRSERVDVCRTCNYNCLGRRAVAATLLRDQWARERALFCTAAGRAAGTPC